VIPSQGEALAIHRKYGTNERIVRHCQIVAEAAKILAEEFRARGHKVDVDAVVAAGLLHDVGRSRIQTVRHGVEGASIMQQEGVDPVIVEIIRRHVGAGISADEAKKLGLPDFDYIPRTLEQRIVCFADKMVSSEEIRPFNEEVRRFEMKGHDVGRLLALKKGLADELGEDPEKILLDKIKESQGRAPE
jgi:uncharacterized protein